MIGRGKTGAVQLGDVNLVFQDSPDVKARTSATGDQLTISGGVMRSVKMYSYYLAVTGPGWFTIPALRLVVSGRGERIAGNLSFRAVE